VSYARQKESQCRLLSEVQNIVLECYVVLVLLTRLYEVSSNTAVHNCVNYMHLISVKIFGLFEHNQTTHINYRTVQNTWIYTSTPPHIIKV
jgi:hypothetical protein